MKARIKLNRKWVYVVLAGGIVLMAIESAIRNVTQILERREKYHDFQMIGRAGPYKVFYDVRPEDGAEAWAILRNNEEVFSEVWRLGDSKPDVRGLCVLGEPRLAWNFGDSPEKSWATFIVDKSPERYLLLDLGNEGEFNWKQSLTTKKFQKRQASSWHLPSNEDALFLRDFFKGNGGTSSYSTNDKTKK